MMLHFAARVCAAGAIALLAGCGDDDAAPSAATTVRAGTPTTPVATRCDLRVARGGYVIVADGLLPDDAFITAIDGDDLVAVEDGALADVYAATLQRAQDAGLTVESSEREAFDAEMVLVGNGGRHELRFAPVRGCDGATEVAIRKE